VRIVRQPHEVAAQFLSPGNQRAIVIYGNCMATAIRRFFVGRNSAQENGLAVEEDLGAASLDGTKADVIGEAIVTGGNHHPVQFWLLRRPQVWRCLQSLGHRSDPVLLSQTLLQVELGDFYSDERFVD